MKQTGVGGILEKALPITVIVVVFLLGALALSPFLPALLWSVFISVALLPLYERAEARTGQRSGLATAAVALGLLLVVLLPMVVLLRAVIAVLPELAAAIAEGGTLATLGFDLPAVGRLHVKPPHANLAHRLLFIIGKTLHIHRQP